ncbi:hypothetical protein ATO10_11382 [Actibacterium atlanticum]|uniref:Putative Flp pilus-assembly TadG-like N-terminal domain-containing protein n=1 Tax=Actibacterium atlanticum TaxID=1461693 RepID=A0A058ZL20_9RHOB|nr:Tad domain-containing protein [Actibacterium atlanticum]KCV81511.1 hypothetical protein ATO10_11382 [Actibacterium atlanticum]
MFNRTVQSLTPRPASGLRRLARSFGRNEEGSMLLFGMYIMIAMLLCAGLAIDTIRFEARRMELQNTLDRAVLAAADLDQDVDARAVVIDYFDKAGLSEFLDTDSINVDSSTASGELSFRRVNATATANITTIWLHLLGVDNLQATAYSTAEEGITDLEVSLVVDVSGSMGWSSSSGNSKIYELRQAAKDFVYYMQCNPNEERGSGADCSVEEGKVSISLVPYAEQVTAGEELLDYMHVTAEHDYSHCVTFSADDMLTTTIPLEDDPDNPDPLQRTGHFDPWNNGTWASNNSRTCRTNNWRKIRPVQGDYVQLINYIDDLSAGGNTSIDVGMKWGAALLDPSMRDTVIDLIGHNDDDGNPDPIVDAVFFDRPYSYTQDYMMKVIVLMTDGVNTDQHYLKDGYREGDSPVWRNTHYSDRYSIYKESTGKYYYTHNGTWNDYPYGDADGEPITVTNTYCTWSWWYGRRCWTETETTYEQQPGSAVQMTYPEVWDKFTTDWFGDWSWLEDPETHWGNGTKNTRLSQICAAARAQGIIVYTIGFEVSGNADDVMSDCASTPGHYFAADGTNLSETFGVIASSINQLRLTQ